MRVQPAGWGGGVVRRGQPTAIQPAGFAGGQTGNSLLPAILIDVVEITIVILSGCSICVEKIVKIVRERQRVHESESESVRERYGQ